MVGQPSECGRSARGPDGATRTGRFGAAPRATGAAPRRWLVPSWEECGCCASSSTRRRCPRPRWGRPLRRRAGQPAARAGRRHPRGRRSPRQRPRSPRGWGATTCTPPRRGRRARPCAWPGSRSGCPLLARRVGARRRPLPALHPAARCRPCAAAKVVVTLHDATFFSDPAAAPGGQGALLRRLDRRLSVRLADASWRRAEATLDEVRAARGGERPRASPSCPTASTTSGSGRPRRTRSPRCARWLGLPRGRRLRRLPRHPRAAQERARAHPGVGRGVRATGPTRRRSCSPGARGWDDGIDAGAGRGARRPARCIRPGFVPDGLVPALLGGARSLPTPRSARASGCPCSRRWPAGRPC